MPVAETSGRSSAVGPDQLSRHRPSYQIVEIQKKYFGYPVGKSFWVGVGRGEVCGWWRRVGAPRAGVV